MKIIIDNNILDFNNIEKINNTDIFLLLSFVGGLGFAVNIVNDFKMLISGKGRYENAVKLVKSKHDKTYKKEFFIEN